MRFCMAFLALVFSSAMAQQTDPGALLNKAVQEQQAGDYVSAIRDYRAFLQISPHTIEAKVNLASALSDTGHYDEAIAIYNEALPQITDKKAVRLNLALAYFRKGDLENSRAQLTSVHQLDPADEQVIVRLANVDVVSGHPRDAISLLEPLDPSKQNDTNFQYLFGTALIAAGLPEAGVPKVEHVAEATKSAQAYLLAGKTLLQYNRIPEARRDLEEALNLDPQLPDLYTAVGLARDKSGDTQAAEAAFRKALQSNANDFDANLTLGAILYKRRELQESKTYLDRALRLKPDNPSAQYQWAMLRSVSGDYEGAVKELEKIAQANQNWLPPHLELAKLYYKLNRPRDGLRERQIAEQIESQQSGPSSTERPR